MNRPQLVVFAEGGFAHFLKHLEGAYMAAWVLRRDLTGVTDHHKALGFLELSQLLSLEKTPDRSKVQTTQSQKRGPILEDMKSQDFFSSYDFSATSPPPLLKSLYRNLLSPSPLVTTGMYFPPGPRFLLATKRFRLSRYLSHEVAKKIRTLDEPISESIGIHLRNTDRATDFGKSQQQLRARLEQSRIKKVFVASDDDTVTEQFCAGFRGIRFFWLEKEFQPLVGSRNLHLGVRDEDALEQLVLALSDIYLLSKCRVFIPAYKSKTQWTHLIRAMRSPLGSRFMQAVAEPESNR